MSESYEMRSNRDIKEMVDEAINGSSCVADPGPSYRIIPEESFSFPPNPTYMLYATAVYLSSEDRSVVLKKGVSMGPLDDKEAAVKLYRNTLKPRQSAMKALLKVTQLAERLGGEGLGSEAGIQEFCIQAVHATGKRLLVAHILGKERDSGKLVDALLIPRAISDGVPLQIRDAVVPYMHLINELPEASQESLRRLTDLSPRSRHTASVAAASFLPSATIVARGMQKSAG